MNALLRFIREEEGISSLEYALIAALIAVVMTIGATLLGVSLQTKFTEISTWLDGMGP